jgi:hypothetical protein
MLISGMGARIIRPLESKEKAKKYNVAHKNFKPKGRVKMIMSQTDPFEELEPLSQVPEPQGGYLTQPEILSPHQDPAGPAGSPEP